MPGTRLLCQDAGLLEKVGRSLRRMTEAPVSTTISFSIFSTRRPASPKIKRQVEPRMQDHSTESSSAPENIPDPCAFERIRTPGSIQPHGLLFILDQDLVILQVSENCGHILQRDASSVIGSRVLDLVTPECAPKVEVLVRDAASTFVNPFRVSIAVGRDLRRFDGIAHAVQDDRFVLELEPATDGPEDGLERYLDVVQRSLTLVAEETGISGFADVMAREIKWFTGFDRVMVYRFAPRGHGQVIAEAKEGEMDSYLGLHYPATDIPQQARELYLTNHVRLLQDVDAIPARLVSRGDISGIGETDLSKAVLRSMSPVHLQYLRNMGVSASFSISLIVGKTLWGLIACHHRSPRFIPYAVRATASLYGTVMAAQLDLLQHGQATMRMAVMRKGALSVLTAAQEIEEPLERLRQMLPKLKELFAADGVMLLAGGKSWCDGATPGEATCVALTDELSALPTRDTVISHSAGEMFPSLSGLTSIASGMVAVSLGEFGWLVVLRGETARRIAWAGPVDRPV
ncbi:MAG: GAF domain-containing protein, partial [Verrucomicrobiaceae bacterium]